MAVNEPRAARRIGLLGELHCNVSIALSTKDREIVTELAALYGLSANSVIRMALRAYIPPVPPGNGVKRPYRANCIPRMIRLSPEESARLDRLQESLGWTTTAILRAGLHAFRREQPSR